MAAASISNRVDPLLAYNFQISLLDSSSSLAQRIATVTLSAIVGPPIAGFSECSGLETSLDVEEYMEGGNNGTVLKFPTRVKWNNIVLKRGIGADSELWDWYYGFVEGNGKRRDGLITLQNERHESHTVWAFRRGLPVKYSGPSLNAAQSNVAIESIEIAHEGLCRIPGISGLASLARSIVG